MNNFLGNDENVRDDFSINFPFFYRIILRNKNLFVSFLLIFTVIGWGYSLTKKLIYKGQFEIVVDVKDNNNRGNNNLPLSLLGDLNFSNMVGSLATEIGILESPSVLRPVYEFVISEKSKLDSNFKVVNFNKWKENSFEIVPKEETSILKIIYRDNDKALIKPVLDKVSKAYQSYSGKTKRRQIELSKDYLSSQIVNFTSKSNKSFQDLQEYAIDNNLSFSNELQQKNNTSMSLKNLETNVFLPNTFIENSRIIISDEIQKINFQLDKITNLDGDYSDLEYLGFMADVDSLNLLMERLNKIDQELLFLKAKYKSNDRNINLINKQKELTVKLLKEKTIGYLKTQKLILQAKLASIVRPKEVILKYKQLLREAARHENILVKLEDQYQVVNLEYAKSEDPWELISEPFIDGEAITNRIRFLLLGSFAGFILGLIASIIKEKNQGFILDAEILEEKFNCKIIEKIKTQNQEYKQVFKVIFENIIGLYKNEKIKFLVLGEENELILNFLKSINLNEIKVDLENKFSNVLDAKKLFILTSLDLVEENEVNYIAEKIQFLDINIEGIILITS